MNYRLVYTLLLVSPCFSAFAEPVRSSDMKALFPSTLHICQNQALWIGNTVSEKSLDPQLISSTPAIDFAKHVCDALEPLASVQVPMFMDLTNPGYFFGSYRHHLYEKAVYGKTDIVFYEKADFFFELLQFCRNPDQSDKDEEADKLCKKVEPIFAEQIPLDYSNILAGDLRSRIEPQQDQAASEIIRMLERTCKDHSMTFAAGPLKLSLDGGPVHYSQPDVFLDDSQTVQFKTRTHYNEHSLYYSHPNINERTAISGETKLIHALKDGFFQSLWRDKAISSCPTTPNGNSYSQDHVNDLILGLQDYIDPRNIPESWFPPTNFALNQKLMARINRGIGNSVTHVQRHERNAPYSLISDEDNIHKLVHWYKHIILRYPQNVKNMLTLVSNHGGKYTRSAYAASEILAASDKSNSNYLYDFETLKLFVKVGSTCELMANVAKYTDYPESVAEAFLQEYIDTIDDVKNVATFKELVECSKSILTQVAYDRFLNIHEEAFVLSSIARDFGGSGNGARILEITAFEPGKKYYLQSEEQFSEILNAIVEYKPGNSWNGNYLKRLAARRLLTLANSKNADYFLTIENIESFIQLGFPLEIAEIVAKHTDGTNLEQIVDPLVSRSRTIEMLDGVKKLLSHFVNRFPPKQFMRKNRYLDDTRTYYGLFKIVRCDEASFKGCATLQEDLKSYYLNSEQEVKDILEIAMSAFLKQDAEKCAPVFKYDMTNNTDGAYGHFAHHGDVLGCEVVVNFAKEMSLEFWSVFVHEMAHKAFHVVYKNHANPYNDDESKTQYKAMMDKIVNPLLGICDDNLIIRLGRYLVGNLMYGKSSIRHDLATVPCLYPPGEHDLENVVRYYQHITTAGLYAADQVFVGMKEFHRNSFLKKAVEAGFLSSDRLIFADN